MENTIQWHLETRNISELKPYFKNPRILTKDQEKQLRTSLDKFGVVDRPCINLDGTIIGGHQRINVLGISFNEIEVMVPSRQLEEREVEELNIRLNHTASWDFDALANAYELDDLLDFGFSEDFLTGDISPLKHTGDSSLEETESQDKCETCGQKIKKKKAKI